MNLAKRTVVAAASLAAIGTVGSVVDARLNPVLADATVTVCAAKGQILDKLNKKQCVTVVQSLGRGQRETQVWNGNSVNVKISNEKATRDKPNSAGDAVKFMETLGDKFYRSLRQHGAVYANIRMQGCTGSWSAYCFEAEIGSKPSGFSRGNSYRGETPGRYATQKAFDAVTARVIEKGTSGKATARTEKCDTRITNSVGWNVTKQCGFVKN